MLYYDRNCCFSESIGINKTSASKECISNIGIFLTMDLGSIILFVMATMIH